MDHIGVPDRGMVGGDLNGSGVPNRSMVRGRVKSRSHVTEFGESSVFNISRVT